MRGWAQIPLVPLSWVQHTLRVTPDEDRDRTAGRPKVFVKREGLTVGDLDHSLTYLQRRTREVQKLVQGAQPDREHTTKIVTAAIKDAIRRLGANLPEQNRVAIDSVVAEI